MMVYNAYYLVKGEHIVAGPFSSVEEAVHGKKKFIPPYAELLTIVKSSINATPV
jgi:hypothetical protein